jgi:toxin YoeB
MEIIYSDEARNDLEYWDKFGSESEKKRIKSLLQSMAATPFSGIGKPEALKYDLSGKWSRRINRSDRIVYRVTHCIEILSFRGHYEDK